MASQYILYTANEGPVSIQYNWLVPIYVFPEMKTVQPRYFQNRIIRSVFQFLLSYIYERCIISRIGLSILLQPNFGLILGVYKSLTVTSM
jgi:hypothetical protein